MSRQIIFKGTFKNGKIRTIGAFNSHGCDFESSKFNNNDIMHILRVSENDKKCFQWQLENNKFKKVEVIGCYSYSKTNIKNYCGYNILIDTLPTNKRLDKKTIEKYIEIVNKF